MVRADWAPNGVIYFWDRKLGRLVGFPGCAPSRSASDCVDPRVLLRSLADPRAIGLGDCALAGMLGLGVNELDSEARYICPPVPCNVDTGQPPETAEIGIIENGSGTAGLRRRPRN